MPRCFFGILYGFPVSISLDAEDYETWTGENWKRFYRIGPSETVIDDILLFLKEERKRVSYESYQNIAYQALALKINKKGHEIKYTDQDMRKYLEKNSWIEIKYRNAGV